MDFIRNHKPAWTDDELAIVFKFYKTKTIKEIKSLLPDRSFCAVKNKVKKVKYG